MIVGSLQNDYPSIRIDGADSVSGKVSGEFRKKAVYALLAAMLAIALYIWIRFEWQFGVGALFALFHDVSLTLGMFSLFQMEFGLQIIAAILAIIGYSLNDTIVVYDRIRENLEKIPPHAAARTARPVGERNLGTYGHDLADVARRAGAAAVLRAIQPVRPDSRNYAGYIRGYIQLGLYGCADLDLAGGQFQQLRAAGIRGRTAGPNCAWR